MKALQMGVSDLDFSPALLPTSKLHYFFELPFPRVNMEIVIYTAVSCVEDELICVKRELICVKHLEQYLAYYKFPKKH